MKKIFLTILLILSLCAGSALAAAGDRHMSAKLTIYLAGVNKPIAEYVNVYYTIEDGCIHIFDKLGPGARVVTFSLGAFGFRSQRE